MTSDTQETVQVNIQLIGFLRKWSDGINPQVKVQVGSTVFDLLNHITQNQEDEFHRALWDYSGQLHGGLELILNGQSIPPRHIKEIQITETSELVIIPVISGGRSLHYYLLNIKEIS